MSRYDNPYNSYGSGETPRRRTTERRHYENNEAYEPRRGESTYDAYRRTSTSSRPHASSRYENNYNAQRRSTNVRGSSSVRSGGTSYSRYESGARYSQAAYERSNPRGAKRNAYQDDYGNVYERPQKRGFSLPRIALPSFGRKQGINSRFGSNRRSSGLSSINLSAVRGPIIAILGTALVIIVAIVLWSMRKVEITLNGESVSVRVGSTIQQVIDTTETKVNPGDLISVSGNKLEDDQGYAFLAKLNDNELDGTATEEYRAAEGDNLTIEDGRDRTEDYDVVVESEQPKLEMGGDSWGNISYVSQWPVVGTYEMRTGKISGETARGDTLTETKNCVVSVHQITPTDGRKLVCLTFDDGPAATYTESYLEILNKYGIHATFFNLGQNVEAYPELCKKIIEQGSEIMSHTYQHQQLSQLDEASLQSEFSTAFADIQENAGVSTTSFRPPYGDFTEGAWLRSGGLASVSVLWNLDSNDWRRNGVDSIVSNSTTGVFNGAIILMHDGGGERSQDVEALPQIIETLQAQGYEFVTVTELMKSDNTIPEDIASGNAAMPEGSTWPTELADSTSTE